jgi:exosome complex RNA-binding protein Rrp4
MYIKKPQVQKVNSDGGLALHTRNLYGKLEHGQLLRVHSSSIKRQKQVLSEDRAVLRAIACAATAQLS